MEKFRKIWSPDKNRWLKETKGLSPMEAWDMFRMAFPDCTDVTYTAFKNQRSRVGASRHNPCNASRKPRPLYSEQVKKGYVRIKVAQPNVWVMKSKWVYMETHPWEDFTERSNYVFLDGNTRNFSPVNIERVPLKLMGIFSSLGGCVEGMPDLTRLRIAQARLKYERLNRLEKLGETVMYGGARCDRERVNRYAREYNSRHRDECRRRARERYWRDHEHSLEVGRAYREKNREKMNAWARAARARKRKEEKE